MGQRPDAGLILFDVEAEEVVLSACLNTPAVAVEMSVDRGMRPDDFFYPSHGDIFRAILELIDQEIPVVPEAVAERGGVNLSDVRSLWMDVLGFNWRYYAERVHHHARWRRREAAARELQEAAIDRDAGAWAAADERLARADQDRAPQRTLADVLYDHLNTNPDKFELPFPGLTRRLTGGLRRGQISLVGGWTSQGKSVLLDQILEHASKGFKAHLYVNEMSLEERGARILARLAGVRFPHVLDPTRLTKQDREKAAKHLPYLPFEITAASGWSAEEIARDARMRKLDIVGIDILHLIQHEDERDLARISRVMSRLAHSGNCHVIATVHLNERRTDKPKRPQPVLGDIRGSGMLKNDADNVFFVWREDEEMHGTPTELGHIFIAKARNGITGGIRTRFNGDAMRFIERDDRLAA